MFPSSYGSYSSSGPYPCYPSSSSSSSFPPFTFLNPDNNAPSNNNNTTTTFLIHDPLPVPYNIPSQHAPNIPESLTNLAVADCGAAAAMFKQEVMSGGGAHHYGISSLLTKKPAKKDRHSKIHTSQGLRDRRVRLSIEIARKFFDLQDMLGFDKASNTLEWLLTKSKRAIKELARSKNCSSVANSFSSSSEGEVDSVVNQVIDGTGDLQQGVVDSEERKLRRAQKEESRAKMKESREKARARARERTSNKMCNNNNNINASGEKVQDLKKKCPAMEDPQFLHQLRSTIQPHEEPARSPKLVQPHPHPHPHLVGSEVPRDDFNVIEESIVIKRKLKQSLMSSSHHQNHVIPKEASFNNSDYHSYPNLSPNWEANNGATGRSNFCTIASMNLSTRLQIFGKSREECTNPRL